MLKRVINIDDKKGWKAVKGSGIHKPSGQSWLDYWKEHTSCNGLAIICSCEDCESIATDGAHIQRTTESREQWIAPMCHNHNCTSDSITLKTGTKLVRANQSLF